MALGVNHFLKNGFSVPYFTPYLCGGMPFIADPQSVYFTLEQALAFFLPVLLATRLTWLVFYLLGYWGFFRWVREVLGVREWVAHLSAAAFVLNGFSFSHLFVGHITHIPFLLAPWLMLALCRCPGNFWNRGFLSNLCLFSLVLVYTCCGGGIHCLVVFFTLILVSLPALFFVRKGADEKRTLFLFLIIAGVLFLALSSAQIVGSFLFFSQFHSFGIDGATAPLWKLVTRYFWFEPASTPQGEAFGHVYMGSWEFVAFVTKWTLPGLFLFLGAQLKGWRQKRLPILSTLALTVVIVLLSAGKGSWFPFFNHYHNPIKVLAGFIPLLIFVSAWSLEKVAHKLAPRMVDWKHPRANLAFGFALLCLVSEYTYYSTSLRKNPVASTIPFRETTFADAFKGRQLPPVMTAVFRSRNDLETSANGATSLACYEPLFGYRNESLKSQVKQGSVWNIRDRKFNLTNPACLLYGKSLGCEPWDRISVTDQENMSRFSAGYDTPTWVPQWQTVWMDLCLLMRVCLVLVWTGSLLSHRTRHLFLRRSLDPFAPFEGAL